MSSDGQASGAFEPSGYALSARARDLRDQGRELEALALFLEAAAKHERGGHPYLAAIALRRAEHEDEALVMFARSALEAEAAGDQYLAAVSLREAGQADEAKARFVAAAAQAEAAGDFGTAISALQAAGKQAEAEEMLERAGDAAWRKRAAAEELDELDQDASRIE